MTDLILDYSLVMSGETLAKSHYPTETSLEKRENIDGYPVICITSAVTPTAKAKAVN